jgi:hypothetical protein
MRSSITQTQDTQTLRLCSGVGFWREMEGRDYFSFLNYKNYSSMFLKSLKYFKYIDLGLVWIDLFEFIYQHKFCETNWKNL